MATTLGAVAVGGSVYLNVGGVRTEFLVVHQGRPSSLYDASCDGTWLLMKDAYDPRQWHSSNSNIYSASTIHAFLNGDFLNQFDLSAQVYIKTVKIPYVNGTGSAGSVASGSSGLSVRAFLLSGYEVGWTQATSTSTQYLPIDGACLSYFSGASNSTRIAKRNGSAVFWWLRSPSTNSTSGAWSVDSAGSYGRQDAAHSGGICSRPAIIMPAELTVDDSGNVTFPVVHKTLIGGVAHEITGGTVNIGGVKHTITKGRTLVGGVGRDITFAGAGTPISDLPEETIVLINENGTPVEYYVACHDYESGLNGPGRTLLVRKEAHSQQVWDAGDVNAYAVSDIDIWFNNSFKETLDADIQGAIGTTTFYYTPGNSTSSQVTTLSRSVFALSVTEYNKSVSYHRVEGSALPIASTLLIAYKNGTAVNHWCRTARYNNTTMSFYINNVGGANHAHAWGDYYARPAFTIPSDITVDADNFVVVS